MEGSLMRGLKGPAPPGNANAARQTAQWPDNEAARAFALLETLNTRILACQSATAALEDWCAGPGSMSGQAIRARRVAGVEKPATPEQRARLRVGPEERVIYRRVDLACGERVLSEAENWYVPSRLDPRVQKILDESDTPFGRVLLNLNIVRETIAAEIFWRPCDGAAPTAELTVPWRLFQHRALICGPDGAPLSEVSETYTSAILAFGEAAGS